MRYGAVARKRVRHSARRGPLTSCDAAPSGGEGWQRRSGVSGIVIWRGDDVMHEARRTATHQLRRGSEQGRGEAAEEKRRERR